MQPASTLESSHKETDISNSRTTTISTSTQIASDMSGVLNAQSTFQQDDLLHHHQSQSFLFGQNDHTHQMMDDFLENMLSISSWSDVATVRNQWEYGGGINPATGLNADSFSQGSKLFKSSLMGHAGNDGSVSGDKFSGENSILVSQFPPDPNEMGGLPTVSATCRIPGLGNSSLQLNSESDPSMRLPPLQGIPEDAGPGGSLHVMSSCAADASLPSIMTVVRSGSGGSSPSEGSPGLENPSWRQLYAGNAPAPSLPLSLGQCASFAGLSQQNESHLLGKRFRDDEPDATKDHRLPYPSRDSSPANMYPYGTSQTGPTQSAKQQTGQGLLAPSYAPAAQPTNISSGTVRPRVRARRGQATDPHSIAERLRRERIAERMKALQELVPNANKTDKASMLDEIIDYVKFLQLQVKVLSMSRLGGAGAVAPFVADLPAEGPHGLLASLGRNSGAMGSMQQEGISLTERQVARLMEEDMGSAMQYLQSKGLCLMPISLATAISTTNAKTVGVSSSSGDKRRPEVPLAVSGGCMMLGSASEKRETSCAEKTTASDPQLGKSAKATKSRDENQR